MRTGLNQAVGWSGKDGSQERKAQGRKGMADTELSFRLKENIVSVLHVSI